jgi:hypothetical protein
VKLTEHDDVLPDPTDNVHAPLLENVPVPPENRTCPVGFPPVPASVSDTVAVQLVEAPTASVAGEHATFVEVDRAVTVSVADPADAWKSVAPW